MKELDAHPDIEMGYYFSNNLRKLIKKSLKQSLVHFDKTENK